MNEALKNQLKNVALCVRQSLESYGFAINQRDALPNASLIGLTPSLQPLGRTLPNVAHSLCRSVLAMSSHRHDH